MSWRTPFSGVEGRVAVKSSVESGSVALLVEDDGPGLSSEQLGKAIQAGQRLDENSPGFGFGLSITRELAELYGGSLSLDRSSIGGLRVAIQLPPAAVNEDQQLGLKGRVEG